MKNKNIINSTVVIATFLFSFYGKQIVNSLFKFSITSYTGQIVYFYSWWIIPLIVALSILFGFKNILKELKIDKGFIFGFSFAFISVLPMFISSAIIGNIDKNISFIALLHKTVIGGFFEELFFRGFLFGILFRKSGWGFIPAGILGAIIFGIGHLYQGSTAAESFGIFLVTAMGALWFAWLFIEWQENLWVAIFLHILMNLSWGLFNVGENALGDFYSNIFRFITIAITVSITIIYKKRKNKFSINRSNLFKNNLI